MSIFGSLRTAKSNISQREDAKKILRTIEEAVVPWLRIPIHELPGMIPPPEVPRAFNSSFDGCPVHGAELFKFGNYSWIIDPFENPWKITCPVGGEEYPSNDFKAYLNSGMTDRSLLIGKFPDDGWGWLRSGEVKKHWFIAYYCHWYWYNHLLPAVLNLSRAFVLTGKEEYGVRGLVLLDRIAEYYPRMNYNAQSRYAEEFSPTYDGKIVNLIWETNVIRNLAEAIDNIRPCITKSSARLVNRDPGQLVEHLEKNILLEGLDGIKRNKIRGNYGMHQRSALVILKALGRDDVTGRWLEFLLDNPGGGYPLQGIRYAMDNFIYREGVAYENAPGYCLSWTSNLLNIAFHLRSLGVESIDWAKLARMAEVPERMICQGSTPAIGDSGGVGPGSVRLSQKDASLAYRMMPSPVLARQIKPGISSYEEIFLPVLDDKGLAKVRGRAPQRRSDCLGGYGLVLLRSRGLECSMYFGRKNGHGHLDRLGIELFALGRKVTPDLGYPQFAAESKNPPAWERNTISHNTVTVNERKQDTGSSGELEMFHSGPVEVAEASARRTYHDASLYNRTVGIIGKDGPIFFDIFRVGGGFAHDYSIHGSSAELTSHGIGMKRRKGTLGGPDVPYTYLYDDPELEDPMKERSFYSYRGSGFSYLYDLEVGRPTRTFWTRWESDGVNLRLYFPHRCQEAIFASGRPPLRPGNPESLRYVILRNRGEELDSSFTAVGEVYRDRGSIESVRPLRVSCGDALARPVGISITRNGTRYLVLSSLESGATMATPGAKFTGRLLVLTLDDAGELVELFMDGQYLEYGDLIIRGEGALEGKVEEVIPGENIVEVVMGDWVKPKLLVGKRVFFRNSRRSSSFRIEEASGSNGVLSLRLESDGKLGRLRAERSGEREVTTDTELILSGYGYYEGARLVDSDYRRWIEITGVEKGRILVDENLDGFSFPDAFVWEFGPGDEVEIGTEIGLHRANRGLVGSTNVPLRIGLGVDLRTKEPGRFTIYDPR